MKQARAEKFFAYLDWLSAQNQWVKSSEKRALTPSHPGLFLDQKMRNVAKLTQTKLAQKLGCTQVKISEIINGKRSITPQFALQLEAVFEIDAEIWVSLQGQFDVWQARIKASL